MGKPLRGEAIPRKVSLAWGSGFVESGKGPGRHLLSLTLASEEGEMTSGPPGTPRADQEQEG